MAQGPYTGLTPDAADANPLAPANYPVLRFGELQKLLHDSNPAAGKPSQDAMNDALTLQAGYRGLRNVDDRRNPDGSDMVAVAGRPTDPERVRLAQNITHGIFTEHRSATTGERSQLLDAMTQATQSLQQQGYASAVAPTAAWLAQQVPAPAVSTRPAGAPARPGTPLAP